MSRKPPRLVITARGGWTTLDLNPAVRKQRARSPLPVATSSVLDNCSPHNGPRPSRLDSDGQGYGRILERHSTIKTIDFKMNGKQKNKQNVWCHRHGHMSRDRTPIFVSFIEGPLLRKF
jgi:hypothetical protein